MVARATRWKFAWQQSPLEACPHEVKDGVEDGTKVGGARTSRRQNRGDQGTCRVGQVGIVEWSAHRNGPFGPDQPSFKTDVNFSNPSKSQNQNGDRRNPRRNGVRYYPRRLRRRSATAGGERSQALCQLRSERPRIRTPHTRP